MRYLTLFQDFDVRLWLCAASGCARWEVLSSLQAYRPRRDDVICGCFTVAEAALLHRLGVRMLTPCHRGQPVPDEETAVRTVDSLTLEATCRFTESRAAPCLQTTFREGPEALLAAGVLSAARSPGRTGRHWVA